MPYRSLEDQGYFSGARELRRSVDAFLDERRRRAEEERRAQAFEPEQRSRVARASMDVAKADNIQNEIEQMNAIRDWQIRNAEQVFNQSGELFPFQKALASTRAQREHFEATNLDPVRARRADAEATEAERNLMPTATTVETRPAPGGFIATRKTVRGQGADALPASTEEQFFRGYAPRADRSTDRQYIIENLQRAQEAEDPELIEFWNARLKGIEGSGAKDSPEAILTDALGKLGIKPRLTAAPGDGLAGGSSGSSFSGLASTNPADRGSIPTAKATRPSVDNPQAVSNPPAVAPSHESPMASDWREITLSDGRKVRVRQKTLPSGGDTPQQ